MSLGDRIKRYESASRFVATPRMPLVVRVDGKAFHTFTKGMERPFDQALMAAMTMGAVDVAREMQGFKIAYVQSDEATFVLTDYDDIHTQGWFDYNISKIVSVSAAMMSVYFWDHLGGETPPVFDSRAFNIPVEDVANCLLWRAQDWERNSLQMYARAHFSHKQLHGKNREDMHEMLYGIGKNWATDLTDKERNGSFIVNSEDGLKYRADIRPNYNDINAVVEPLIS